MARIVKTEACATVNSTNGTALPEIRKSLLLKNYQYLIISHRNIKEIIQLNKRKKNYWEILS